MRRRRAGATVLRRAAPPPSLPPAVAIAVALAVLLSVACSTPLAADPLPAVGPGPSLQEAVAAALARNPLVAAASVRRAAADEGVDAAYAGYLPRLDLTLSSGYGWIEFSDAAGIPEGSSWSNQAVVQLRQRLWDAGSTAGTLAAAEAGEAAAAAAQARAAEDMAQSVVAAYLEALAAELLVGLSRESLEAHRRLLGLVGQQEAAGLVTTADRLEVEGRVALAEAELIAAQGRLAVGAARLESLTWLAPPATAARGEGALGLWLPPLPLGRLPADPAAALTRAVAGSPLLDEAAAAVRQRQAEAAAAGAEAWPTLDLVLLGRAANDLPGIDGPLLEAVGLVQFRWRLFDGFGTEAEVRRLSALGSAARYDLDDQRRRLGGRLARAYAQLDALQRQGLALEAALAAQGRTYDDYLRQFAIGERGLLELLDARRELDRVRRAALYVATEQVRVFYAVAHDLGELRAWLLDANLRAPEPPAVSAGGGGVPADGGRPAGGGRRDAAPAGRRRATGPPAGRRRRADHRRAGGRAGPVRQRPDAGAPDGRPVAALGRRPLGFCTRHRKGIGFAVRSDQAWRWGRWT